MLRESIPPTSSGPCPNSLYVIWIQDEFTFLRATLTSELGEGEGGNFQVPASTKCHSRIAPYSPVPIPLFHLLPRCTFPNPLDRSSNNQALAEIIYPLEISYVLPTLGLHIYFSLLFDANLVIYRFRAPGASSGLRVPNHLQQFTHITPTNDTSQTSKARSFKEFLHSPDAPNMITGLQLFFPIRNNQALGGRYASTSLIQGQMMHIMSSDCLGSYTVV